MLDRLILSAVLGTVGWNGLNKEPPQPMTLKQKAVYKSVSAVCERKVKKQSKTVKQMCKRWEEHNG